MLFDRSSDARGALMWVWAEHLALSPTSTEDRFVQPSAGGYRAVHLGFEFGRPNEWNLPNGASVEVQITTWLQHFHGVISHRALYKPVAAPAPEVSRFLTQLAGRLGEIDEEISAWMSCGSTSKSPDPNAGD